MAESYPFHVKHFHKVSDVIGQESEASPGSGFHIECHPRTEYGPALLSKDELEKVSSDGNEFYKVTFIAQSYYCNLCKERIAYARIDEEGRQALHTLREGVAVFPLGESDEEVRLNESLIEIYGLIANLMELEESGDERLLLSAVRSLYARDLVEAKKKLLALLDTT